MYISKSKKITDEDLNSKLQKEVKKVTIFGYSECEKDDELYSQAYKTGKLLAQKGYIVVNGAGPGVMRASSEGAKAGGGKTIGISLILKPFLYALKVISIWNEYPLDLTLSRLIDSRTFLLKHLNPPVASLIGIPVITLV